MPQRKSPRLSQASYNSVRKTRNSKERVSRDTTVLTKKSGTGTSGKVSRVMRNLEASYNPDASGILSQVASRHGNQEKPQVKEPVIESSRTGEDSTTLDNQNQNGPTHIIEDIDDDDHETGRETAAVSFEQVVKDVNIYLCELVQLGVTEKVDTKVSTYDYDKLKSYEEAWYHNDTKQQDK